MTEALHDAQDATEDMAERANAIVDETVKAAVPVLLTGAETPDDLPEPMATWVGELLACEESDAVDEFLDVLATGVETLDDLFEPLALLVESRLAGLTSAALRSGLLGAVALRKAARG